MTDITNIAVDDNNTTTFNVINFAPCYVSKNETLRVGPRKQEIENTEFSHKQVVNLLADCL